MGRLAGGVAHDFNNMLGVILGHVDMAMEDLPTGDPLHNSLQEINRAAERSAKLTRQLLAFARKQMASPRVIDLNDIVSATASLLQRLIGESIKLVWRPGAYVHPVKLDPTQLEQILVNLCINARDAIDNMGQIIIETGNTSVDDISTCTINECLPGDYAILRVRDNGCGMDQDTMTNLFEPFFTTKDIGKGTGLGLATVYGIVRQNNGFIKVESEVRQGATFTIYLPRHHVEPESSPNTPDRESDRTPDTILLVEDEQMNLTMVKLILERQGFRVITALTPNEAIIRANEHEGDIRLLLTDVVMPEMNGRDLAIRLLNRHPGIKVLYMSGYTDDIIARHGVLEEGLHFIQKPFTSGALIAHVKKMLDQDNAPN
nr:ATP-binding protein [Desulfofustis limnaeus]